MGIRAEIGEGLPAARMVAGDITLVTWLALPTASWLAMTHGDAHLVVVKAVMDIILEISLGPFIGRGLAHEVSEWSCRKKSLNPSYNCVLKRIALSGFIFPCLLNSDRPIFEINTMHVCARSNRDGAYNLTISIHWYIDTVENNEVVKIVKITCLGQSTNPQIPRRRTVSYQK